MPSFWIDYDIIYPLYLAFSNVCYSTASAICSLVIILIFWTIDLFKILRERISKLVESNNDLLLNDVEILSEWKRQHCLVIVLVDHINNCFGSIISLIIFHDFFSLISYTYMAIFVSSEEQTLYSLFYSVSSFFTQFFQLCMVIYAGHLLQHQVLKIVFQILFLFIEQGNVCLTRGIFY